MYIAVYELNKEHDICISALCEIAGIARSAYYKWLKRTTPEYEQEIIEIANLVKKIYQEGNSKGYRRINDDLLRNYSIKASDKRILRICRVLGIRSKVKYKSPGCTVDDTNPAHVEENVLNRDFNAAKPNEKWVTDVTEFKYYINGEKHKLYLSAILDLYDRRVVAYEIGDSNNNELVFNTFDHALEPCPNAHPLFHSDRGFQYTNATFHQKLTDAKMTQSMSRVGKCLDNGPMEGFWGILKRERYYGHKFTCKSALEDMIKTYIEYYNNNKRYQRKLGILTPIEKHMQYYANAA